MEFTVDLAAKLLKQQKVINNSVIIEGPNIDGTDHAIFFIDNAYTMRLPRSEWVVAQVLKEQTWLPYIEKNLDVKIPHIVYKGKPCDEFGLPWTLNEYIPGIAETDVSKIDNKKTALEIAQFINQLHSIPITTSLEPGDHNFGRGMDIYLRKELTFQRINEITEYFSKDILTECWTRILEQSEGEISQKSWIHGDIQPGNMIFTSNSLTGVIDFGGLAIGDGAVDFIPAWNSFLKTTREYFKNAVIHDENAWVRGQAWAFSIAVLEISYHKDNEHYVKRSQRVIHEILGEYGLY